MPQLEPPNFELYAGNDAVLRLAIMADASTVFDLSGVQDIVWTARVDLTSPPAITKTKSGSGGIDLATDGTDGICLVHIAAADSAGLPANLIHEARVTDPDGNVVTVISGRLLVGVNHWTYSGNPKTSPKDAVRFLIGDTNSDDGLVSDEEITFSLDMRGSPYGAAAEVCRSLAAKYARDADSSSRDMRESYSQRSSAYRSLVKAFEDKAQAQFAVVPIAGLLRQFI